MNVEEANELIVQGRIDMENWAGEMPRDEHWLALTIYAMFQEATLVEAEGPELVHDDHGDPEIAEEAPLEVAEVEVPP